MNDMNIGKKQLLQNVIQTQPIHRFENQGTLVGSKLYQSL